MFCPKCGKEIQNGDMFCWNCGAKIGSDEPAAFHKEATDTVKPQTTSYAAPVTPAYEPPKTEEYHTPVSTAAPEKETKVTSQTISEAADTPENYDYKKLPTTEVTGIRSIYIIDFLIRMTGKANIPLFIYLIINVLIIGGIASLFLALPIGWGILTGLLVYIASISIALSPIGEWMLRRQTGCRQINDAAIVARLEPIFNEVYYKAKKVNPMISGDVRLFINDDDCPNAFATGRKTVCVTRGLLTLSDEQIKATLGHEFGHLSHKDTDRILVVSIGNTVITAICVMFQIAAIVSDVVMQFVAIFTGDEEGFFISLMSSISRFFTIVLIGAFMKVWTMLGTALCMKTSRGNEYLADEFSVNLGYADGLIELLAIVRGERPQGLFANLASSHPHSDDRIARIRALADTKQLTE